MTQLEKFLFELSFGEIKKIRDYMLKRYHVYCGTMEKLAREIDERIPEPLEELYEVLA